MKGRSANVSSGHNTFEEIGDASPSDDRGFGRNVGDDVGKPGADRRPRILSVVRARYGGVRCRTPELRIYLLCTMHELRARPKRHLLREYLAGQAGERLG